MLSIGEKKISQNKENANLDALIALAEERGFEVEENRDIGAGQVDVIFKINIHPSLPTINCGFIVLKSDEGGSQDYEDNQFSPRKIEEAIMRGLRSGLDKIYLVVPNEEMAKSVSGKIEWLASFGSLIRLDAVSLGISPEQQESAVITPSRKRVPEGEKLRKQTIRKRESKIERYSKPKGEKSRKESELRKIYRESLLDKHNRPKSQRKRKENRR
jgi:peptidyl-tRNA hydrolase